MRCRYLRLLRYASQGSQSIAQIWCKLSSRSITWGHGASIRPSSGSHKCQNPNWGKSGPPSPATFTEFEMQVRQLGLSRQTCADSAERRRWCELKTDGGAVNSERASGNGGKHSFQAPDQEFHFANGEQSGNPGWPIICNSRAVRK